MIGLHLQSLQNFEFLRDSKALVRVCNQTTIRLHKWIRLHNRLTMDSVTDGMRSNHGDEVEFIIEDDENDF
jgi:hypothetical protein